MSQQLFPFLLFRQGDVKKKKKKKKGKLHFLAVDVAQLQRAHQTVSSNSQSSAPQELEPFAGTGSLWTRIFMIACLDGAFFPRSESNTLTGWCGLLGSLCFLATDIPASLVSWPQSQFLMLDVLQESCLRTMTPRWLLTLSGGFQCESVPTIVDGRRARRRIRLARGLRVQPQLAPLNCKYPFCRAWCGESLLGSWEGWVCAAFSVALSPHQPWVAQVKLYFAAWTFYQVLFPKIPIGCWKSKLYDWHALLEGANVQIKFP